MGNIPGLRKSHWGFKLVLILAIVAVAAYFLIKGGVIDIPFALPF